VDFEAFALPAVILVSLTALVLLANLDWRLTILALAIQYAGVFVLVGLAGPLEMAASKLVAGWKAGAVLGMAMVSVPQNETMDTAPTSGWPDSLRFPTGRLFRLFAAALVILAVLSLAPTVQGAIPAFELAQVRGGMILIGMGLLQLGFTANPFRTIVGLLTLLAGFEIFYASVERSVLVAGLLAAVNLGLALIGSYLVIAPSMEEIE
jgi:hypothetical protein